MTLTRRSFIASLVGALAPLPEMIETVPIVAFHERPAQAVVMDKRIA
jgi:hypothetical protein